MQYKILETISVHVWRKDRGSVARTAFKVLDLTDKDALNRFNKRTARTRAAEQTPG